MVQSLLLKIMGNLFSSIRQHAKKTRELWWQGLPPSVRGTVWKLAIGNDLHITHGKFS